MRVRSRLGQLITERNSGPIPRMDCMIRAVEIEVNSYHLDLEIYTDWR